MAIKYSDGSSSADGRIIQIANAQIAGNNIRTQTNAPNACLLYTSPSPRD